VGWLVNLGEVMRRGKQAARHDGPTWARSAILFATGTIAGDPLPTNGLEARET
jgi:hypothetical protein